MKTPKLVLVAVVLFSLSLGMVSGSNGPSPRMGPRMVYDPVNERALLFGGSLWDQTSRRYTFYNDMWEYNVESETWRELELSLKPQGRFNHMMAYDPDTRKIVLFGGFSSQDRIGDTWTFDVETDTWTRMNPEETPAPRSDGAFTYDQGNKLFVLFDGYGLIDDHPNDTWVYNVTADTWTEMNPDSKPKPQYGCYMEYDTVNQEVIMYGGHWSTGGSVHGYSDGVWTYDYPTDTWTKVDDATTPPHRYWHNTAYDSDTGKMVVFGGSQGGSNILDDTWLFDYSTTTWERITTEIGPSARMNSAMVYDPDTGKVVLFGGLAEFGEEPYNDLWLLDVDEPVWTQLGFEPEVIDPQETEDPSSGIPGFSVQTLLIGLIITMSLIRSTHQSRTRQPF